jgi:proline dehydrogenase
MEGSDLTESTLSIFQEAHADYPEHVGIVLQAYLHRTAEDIDRMCDLNARVRICKGAYKEPAGIAYQDMDTIRSQYLEYAKKLILTARYPGVATHDDRLLQAVGAFVRDQNIPDDRFEYQMLYGIRPDTQAKIAESGSHMRVYVPYGTDWLPYYTRRLRERKENVWFVIKHLFSK